MTQASRTAPTPPLEDGPLAVLQGRLSALSTRWGLPVALQLARGPQRYSELARALPGTAPKTLTSSLNGLRATGVIVLDEPEQGPRRYRLSAEGRRIVAALVHVTRTNGTASA